MTDQIDNCLPITKDFVFLIDLKDSVRPSPLAKQSSRLTSSNLNAARLFNPWTLALIANLSFPCRLCHRLDDEDE